MDSLDDKIQQLFDENDNKGSVDDKQLLGEKGSVDGEQLLEEKGAVDSKQLLGEKGSVDGKPLLEEKGSVDSKQLFGEMGPVDQEKWHKFEISKSKFILLSVWTGFYVYLCINIV